MKAFSRDEEVDVGLEEFRIKAQLFPKAGGSLAAGERVRGKNSEDAKERDHVREELF